MSAKAIFVIGAQVLLVQSVLSQCLGRAGPAIAAPALGLGIAAPGYGLAGLAAPAAGLGLAGYGAADLGLAGYGAAGLGLAGYGGADLGLAGYGAAGLGLAGYGAADLGLAGYGAAGLGLAGYGAADLGLAGYGAVGLGLAGYGSAGLGLAGYGAALAAPAIEYTATSGGALPVSSASAIAPTGISVDSENVYEGALSLVGELPFVGTVGLDGVFPTAGAGVVNHACGNGVTAIASDSLAYAPAAGYGVGLAGIAPAAGIGAGLAAIAPAAAIGPIGAYGGAAYGLGAGLGCGCGNGLLY